MTVNMATYVPTSTIVWLLLIVPWVIMGSASIASAGDSLLADVTIFNMLADMIGIHCQSNDRDLHQEWLLGNSGRYNWDFYPRIWWGHTEWYCNFKWPAGGKWQYFLVWTENYQPCVHCVWLVKRDGFWRVREGTGGMALIHPWLDVFPPPK